MVKYYSLFFSTWKYPNSDIVDWLNNNHVRFPFYPIENEKRTTKHMKKTIKKIQSIDWIEDDFICYCSVSVESELSSREQKYIANYISHILFVAIWIVAIEPVKFDIERLEEVICQLERTFVSELEPVHR